MLNSTLRLKIQQRLNKLASSDYDNLECWQIVEAFNKAQLEWCRRQIMGRNITQEGAEQTTRKIDDLENLLTPFNLVLSNTVDYSESGILPTDYLEFCKIDCSASNSCCAKPKKMIVYVAEEVNSTILLRDVLKQPNFEWAETFCTLVDGKIRIYTNNEFTVDSAKLLYYRKPINIEIAGCGNPNTGTITVVDVACEFRDDIAEILVDEAAAILAGDIESFNQFTRNGQAAENNT